DAIMFKEHNHNSDLRIKKDDVPTSRAHRTHHSVPLLLVKGHAAHGAKVGFTRHYLFLRWMMIATPSTPKTRITRNTSVLSTGGTLSVCSDGCGGWMDAPGAGAVAVGAKAKFRA